MVGRLVGELDAAAIAELLNVDFGAMERAGRTYKRDVRRSRAGALYL